MMSASDLLECAAHRVAGDERFVALHVENGVEVAEAGEAHDFCDSISAGRVRSGGHDGLAASLANALRNLITVRGNDDAVGHAQCGDALEDPDDVSGGVAWRPVVLG
jgi:hypothetical protein